MSPQPRYAVPTVPAALKGLVELALDMRWSWSHYGDELWEKLDPGLWDVTHNPWLLLQTISQTRLEEFARDPDFRKLLHHHLASRRETLEARTWFQESYPSSAEGASALGPVAYFSMEFGLSEALPLYSGGLGILAGDFLKASSDLGLPVVGVGLLYQQGFFRQALDAQGGQIEFFPFNDPGQLPMMPVRDSDGEWLSVTLELPRRTVRLRVWEVQAGRVKLYLLDTNDPTNSPADRGIASELYGGSPEMRLQQEMVLGIAGWRVLRALGIAPQICHLNEGHAALAVLERARDFMDDNGVPFEVALTATRAGNLFTTHTPVEAGFDRFPPSLVSEYLGGYAAKLGLGMPDLLALGRSAERADATSEEPFNMAYLAIHASGAVNGVSRLHGEVSRRLFQPLYPRWPEKEIPVGHVTNGVHVPSWDSPDADDLWTKACGPDRWLDGIGGLGDKIRRLDDRELWQFRNTSRHKLVMMAREHVTRQGPVAGSLDTLGHDVSCLCDPDILTLGFARRFTEYKRCNLLLHDMARAESILCADGGKVQLVMAGKAHPADAQGKAMIREWTDFIGRCNVRPHVIFLVDYDMAIAEHLVHGVDVWLNTPRRPWEASGTSGMKVLANGGLNLSELDGWWAEAYAPEVGWAIGDGKEHDPAWDAAEAEQLYDLLENQVIPEFYDRDGEGIPRRWVARIRESMARLAPMFSTSRMVNDYVDGFYLPASAAYVRRSANGAAEAKDIVGWEKALDEQWQNVGFVDYQATHETAPGGGDYSFRAQVRLGALPPSAVRVELYAEPREGGDTSLATAGQTLQSGRSGVPEVHRLSLASPSIGESGPKPDLYTYETSLPATRPVEDYTPRIVGGHPAALVPLEATHICWRK